MTEPVGRPPLSRREKFALTVAGLTLLALAFAVAVYMMTHRPRPDRRKPVPAIPVVSVEELTLSDFLVVVPVMGTIVPATEVDLKTRVGGQVEWTHPEFVDGGIVKKGETLLRIDPVDYQLALTAKKALLETARADLKAEQGKQAVAQREWEILGLGEEASEMDRELALRKPQLAEMEAALEAAMAQVRQAELDLARTTVQAPFNALVRGVDVHPGAQVTAQASLANLVGTDTYYVEALIPLDRIEWIEIPDGSGDSPGSVATVRTGTGGVRQGRVFKLAGNVQTEGRLARLLIEVRDPLALGKAGGEKEPMLLGDYVSAQIAGRTLEDVFNIPRKYLKDGNRVYIVDGANRLRIKEIQIIWKDVVSVVARGLQPGELLAVSDLPAAVEGMEVRVAD